LRDNQTLKALRRLSRQRLDPDQIDDFLIEINSGTDRAVAVVWGGLVEDALRDKITKKISHLNSDEISNLFDSSGPLSTFGGKIIVAYGSGFITKEQERELYILKEIRNVFAHALTHVSFETAEISAACSLLIKDHEIMTNIKLEGKVTNRGVYSWCCLRLFQSLHVFDSAFIQQLETGETHALRKQTQDEPAT
jgi:hypothetical protein